MGISMRHRTRALLFVWVATFGLAAMPVIANAQGGGAGPSTPQATSTHIQTIQCGNGGFLGTSTDEIYSYEENQAGYWAPGLSNLSLLGNKSIYRDNVLVYSGSPNGGGNSTVAINGPGGAHWSITDVGGSHVYRIDTYYSDVYQYNGDFNTAQATNPALVNNAPHGPRTFRGNDFTFGGCSSGGGGSNPPPAEICGDGVDNNHNGQVDEGCPPPPAQTVTLSGQAVCNGTTPENRISWTVPNGVTLWSLNRDGASVAFVPSGSSYADVSPPSGSHAYTASGLTSSFGFIDSNTVTLATATCGSTTPGQLPPTAGDDQGRTVSLVPVSIPVLSNDSDPDGDLDAASLAIVAQPGHGAVSLTTDHKARYASDASFTGTDSFTYKVCDAGNRCATATVLVTVDPNTAPTNVTYQWTLIPKGASVPGVTQFGSLVSNPTLNPSRFTAGASCLLLQDFGPITLKLDVTGTLKSGEPAAGSATKILSAADSCGSNNGSVIGDIFGQTGVSGINVGRNSVVTSNQRVSVEGNAENYKIENYTPKAQLAWSAIQQAASDTTSRLLREKARVPALPKIGTTYYITQGFFNLNPKNGGNPLTEAENDNSNSDGGVWHIPGNLRITGGVQFRGKGTIIVDGTDGRSGQLTVDGPIAYQDNVSDLLGVIVLGSDSSLPAIAIQGASPTDEIRGVFFAPNGTIQLKAPLQFTSGLFVGNNMSFDPALAGLSIQYDQRITTSPPPGFAQSFVPSLGETAP